MSIMTYSAGRARPRQSLIQPTLIKKSFLPSKYSGEFADLNYKNAFFAFIDSHGKMTFVKNFLSVCKIDTVLLRIP